MLLLVLLDQQHNKQHHQRLKKTTLPSTAATDATAYGRTSAATDATGSTYAYDACFATVTLFYTMGGYNT